MDALTDEVAIRDSTPSGSIPQPLASFLQVPDLELVRCPRWSLWENSGLKDREWDKTIQSLERLQTKIGKAEQEVEGYRHMRFDGLSHDRRTRVLKVSYNYAAQWEEAKHFARWHKEHPPVILHYSARLRQQFSMDRYLWIAHSHLRLLITAMSSEMLRLAGPEPNPKLTEAVGKTMSQLDGFRLSDAIALDIRKGHDQTRWRKEVEERGQIRKGAPTFKNYMDGRPPPSADELEGTGTKKNLKARQAPGVGEMAWCPVLKDFIPKKEGITAHIVPHKLQSDLAEKIFQDGREGKDIIYDSRNGVWMAKNVEKAFDNAQIILLPTNTDNPDFDNDTFDVKVVVLDKSLLDSKRNMILSFELPGSGGETKDSQRKFYWNDVDGTILDFRGAKARPARRFLYFNFLHAGLRIAYQKPRHFE